MHSPVERALVEWALMTEGEIGLAPEVQSLAIGVIEAAHPSASEHTPETAECAREHTGELIDAGAENWPYGPPILQPDPQPSSDEADPGCNEGGIASSGPFDEFSEPRDPLKPDGWVDPEDDIVLWGYEGDTEHMSAVWVDRLPPRLQPTNSTPEDWTRAPLLKEAGTVEMGVVHEADSTPEGREPDLLFATVRESDSDEWTDLECRFSDGQKFVAVQVAADFPRLAHKVASAFGTPGPDREAEIRREERERIVEIVRQTFKEVMQATGATPYRTIEKAILSRITEEARDAD